MGHTAAPNATKKNEEGFEGLERQERQRIEVGFCLLCFEFINSWGFFRGRHCRGERQL